MRRVVMAVLLVAPLVGCGWVQSRYDPGRSGANPVERTLTQANVGSLQEVWRASLGPSFVRGSVPIVAGGRVYAHRGPSEVAVFDAAGVEGCAGTPRVCSPLWTMPVTNARGSVALGAGSVFAVAAGELLAFDAAGTAGCSGSPKMCAPLWRSATGGDVSGDPLVVDGRVIVGSISGVVRAYAATPTGCAGSPVVCQPLWHSTTILDGFDTSSPAAAAGRVYVRAGDHVAGFDVAGCAAPPCAPIWRATNVYPQEIAIANGWMYAEPRSFDLSAPCTGTPAVCRSLFSMSLYPRAPVAIGDGYLAQQGGGGNFFGFGVYEWPPQPDCPGGPTFCHPEWVCECFEAVTGGPAIANGMMLSAEAQQLKVFGLAFDDTRCRPTNHGPESPIPPTVPSCDPVATIAIPQVPGSFDWFNPAAVVTGGRVYIATTDVYLHVLALPPA